MLTTVLNVGPPLILIVGMLGVGMSMTGQNVSELVQRPGRFISIALAQILFLPMVGLLTVIVLPLPTHVAAAILLISICPGGGLSNMYVHYAGANTALSVLQTLTTILLASLTVPIMIVVTSWFGFATPVSVSSIWILALQLLLAMIAPISLGILLRVLVPNFAAYWEKRLRQASAVMILAILTLVLWVEWGSVAAHLGTTLQAAALFLALALALGFLAGSLTYSNPDDRYAVATEFGVRNLTIGTFLAVGLSGDLSFAGPAAIYLLIEAMVILTLGTLHRHKRTPEPKRLN